MKTIAFFLLILIPVITRSQLSPASNDKLKAEVYGDSVILRDDTAERNCGAHYTMQITSINSNTLKWVEKDYGSVAYCFCNFNLSVTIDSLQPGDYTVDTYYTHPGSDDLTYVGTISFTISKPNAFLTPYTLDQSQSSCFTLGVSSDNEPPGSALKVYPNPVRDFATIVTDLPGDKIIIISDLANNCILQIDSERNEIKIDLTKLPAQMYFVTVKNREKTVQAKICKN